MSSSTNVDEAWSLWKYNFTVECYKHAPLNDKKIKKMSMTHAGNQTDDESSGCQSHEIP